MKNKKTLFGHDNEDKEDTFAVMQTSTSLPVSPSLHNSSPKKRCIDATTIFAKKNSNNNNNTPNNITTGLNTPKSRRFDSVNDDSNSSFSFLNFNSINSSNSISTSASSTSHVELIEIDDDESIFDD